MSLIAKCCNSASQTFNTQARLRSDELSGMPLGSTSNRSLISGTNGMRMSFLHNDPSLLPSVIVCGYRKADFRLSPNNCIPRRLSAEHNHVNLANDRGIEQQSRARFEPLSHLNTRRRTPSLKMFKNVGLEATTLDCHCVFNIIFN